MTIRLHHGNHVDGGTDRPVADPVGEVPAGARAGRRLGVLGLALVLIAAMDSIRNLPTTATFGWAAIFFYAICRPHLPDTGRPVLGRARHDRRRRHVPVGPGVVRVLEAEAHA
jgi:hypothetical protein